VDGIAARSITIARSEPRSSQNTNDGAAMPQVPGRPNIPDRNTLRRRCSAASFSISSLFTSHGGTSTAWGKDWRFCVDKKRQIHHLSPYIVCVTTTTTTSKHHLDICIIRQQHWKHSAAMKRCTIRCATMSTSHQLNLVWATWHHCLTTQLGQWAKITTIQNLVVHGQSDGLVLQSHELLSTKYFRVCLFCLWPIFS